jgi:phage shock protein PspC (stress-responsive transcriptional regulator)
MKKLYLSEENKKILGVCGGFGETFNIDPTLVRLMLVFLCIATGVISLLLNYLAAKLIVPEKLIE